MHVVLCLSRDAFTRLQLVCMAVLPLGKKGARTVDCLGWQVQRLRLQQVP